ncbi:MAG: hypothetical protein WC175_03895, partial [Candidatus Dojkabacteria bacterium]
LPGFGFLPALTEALKDFPYTYTLSKRRPFYHLLYLAPIVIYRIVYSSLDGAKCLCTALR